MRVKYKIKANSDDVYLKYLEMTKPFHNLSEKETLYFSIILKYYDELSELIKGDTLIWQTLRSKIYQNKIKDDYGTVFNKTLMLKALLKKKVLESFTTEELIIHRNYRVKLTQSKEIVLSYELVLDDRKDNTKTD